MSIPMTFLISATPNTSLTTRRQHTPTPTLPSITSMSTLLRPRSIRAPGHQHREPRGLDPLRWHRVPQVSRMGRVQRLHRHPHDRQGMWHMMDLESGLHYRCSVPSSLALHLLCDRYICRGQSHAYLCRRFVMCPAERSVDGRPSDAIHNDFGQYCLAD